MPSLTSQILGMIIQGDELDTLRDQISGVYMLDGSYL